MQNKIRLKRSRIKAFTMLESLLVLGLVSILALGLSGSVQSTFAAVEEQIFFMEFEEFYRETQKRSVASQQKTSLNLDGQTISNGSQKLTVPKELGTLFLHDLKNLRHFHPLRNHITPLTRIISCQISLHKDSKKRKAC